MASKFAIRENGSNTFCTSTKFSHFNGDLNNAALFASRANAEKAVRSMTPKQMTPYGGHTWCIVSEDGVVVEVYHKAFLAEYIALLETKLHLADQVEHLKEHGVERAMALEVVELKLILV